MKRIVSVLLFAVLAASPLLAVDKKKLAVTVAVQAAPQAVSPEGFVEGTNAWIDDSVADLKKALNGKDFKPNKTCPGTPAQYTVVSDPALADVVLTVAARGTNVQAFGQRTTATVYGGVFVANSVPTYGVTRWVSIILGVDTYRKEFVAWSTNRSRWSAGAWTTDTNLLAKMAACWVMNNEARIIERRKARNL